MLKNFLFTIMFFLVCLFFYFVFIEYKSDSNKAKINKNRLNIESTLLKEKKNLLILPNDTNNIIEYNSGFTNTQKKTKRNFWNLIKSKWKEEQ